MRHLLFIILLAWFTASCENRLFQGKPDIVIEVFNNSSDTLRNIQLTTSEEVAVVVINQLLATQKKTVTLSMYKNKTDGSFKILYTKNNNEIDSLTAGYYTNGYPLNKKISYQIETDTLLVKFD